MSWREQAACAKLPWEERSIFFGEAEDGTSFSQHRQAQFVCYTCPVQVECLQYALELDPPAGVWGGLTESQRKRYLYPTARRYGKSKDVVIHVLVKVGQRFA